MLHSEEKHYSANDVMEAVDSVNERLSATALNLYGKESWTEEETNPTLLRVEYGSTWMNVIYGDYCVANSEEEMEFEKLDLASYFYRRIVERVRNEYKLVLASAQQESV